MCWIRYVVWVVGNDQLIVNECVKYIAAEQKYETTKAFLTFPEAYPQEKFSIPWYDKLRQWKPAWLAKNLN